MWVTSPSSTSTLFCLRRIIRVGGAISPDGDDAGRHLVQQRLEQVMGGPGDQLDVDVGALELLGRVKSAEP